MKKAKVSIIIPVYNVERYLEECLNSALSQDYENIEVVAVNDGSTDGSLALLKDFKENYPNLVVLTIKNQGPSGARNVGLESATGNYILFLDSDDWIEKNTVSTCMEAMDEHGVDMVLFDAKAFCDGVDRELLKKYNYERHSALQERPLTSHYFFAEAIKLNNYLVSPCLYLVSREKIADLRFYPGILHEDNLFTTQLLLADCQLKVTCIGAKLFNRRVRPDSITTEKKNQRHVHGYITVSEELAKESVMMERSGAGKALQRFVGDLMQSAIAISAQIYGRKLPLTLRKRAFCFALHNFKNLRFRTMILCVLPEILVIRSTIRAVGNQ